MQTRGNSWNPSGAFFRRSQGGTRKPESFQMQADRKSRSKEMLGSESIFYLKTKAGEYAARLTVDTKGAPGDEMTLYVDMNRVHFFDADTEKIFLSWRSAMKQLMEKTKGRNAYFYLIPCFLVFAVFLFYPFVKTIYLSLFLTDKLGQAKVFVGLDNYVDLLTSESFYNSLLVTVIFVVIVVIGSMLIGLIGAVLCSKAFPGIRVFSTSYALPMAIASSGAAMIFQDYSEPDNRYSEQTDRTGYQLDRRSEICADLCGGSYSMAEQRDQFPVFQRGTQQYR